MYFLVSELAFGIKDECSGQLKNEFKEGIE